MECSYKNRSHWKNISQEKIRRQPLVVYVLIYPLSKFEGNRTNFLWVLAFYSVRFRENLIRENSAKYAVNQTRNFYFRPKLKTTISLPIFNLFQIFLIYIRDFIWVITLTEKSKFENIVDLKVYCNLKREFYTYLYLVDISSSFPIFFIAI